MMPGRARVCVRRGETNRTSQEAANTDDHRARELTRAKLAERGKRQKAVRSDTDLAATVAGGFAAAAIVGLKSAGASRCERSARTATKADNRRKKSTIEPGSTSLARIRSATVAARSPGAEGCASDLTVDTYSKSCTAWRRLFGVARSVANSSLGRHPPCQSRSRVASMRRLRASKPILDFGLRECFAPCKRGWGVGRLSVELTQTTGIKTFFKRPSATPARPENDPHRASTRGRTDDA
jgi:hypothetical protein